MKKNFEYLVATFRSSIKTWDYFVNWNKVFANRSHLEISLNKLNYLLGKEDLRSEFLKLYNSNRDIARAIPVLLAVRESNLEIFDIDSKNSEFIDFNDEQQDAIKIFDFISKSGLSKLFQKDGVKNLVDYVMGVEVGLDSNGRKNRGGNLMESITEKILLDFCNKKGYELLRQARPSNMLKKWGVSVTINKSERSFDFAIYNKEAGILKLFETNFYNGGGSKLKAVCGEFRNLYDELKPQGVDFVWITDGLGWTTTKRPLEETYNHNDFVFNLSMLESGVLDELNW